MQPDLKDKLRVPRAASLVGVLLLVAAIYLASGLPVPWATPGDEAYGRMNRESLRLLAELRREAVLKKESDKVTMQDMEDAGHETGIQLRQLLRERPGGTSFSLLPIPQPAGDVVLLGTKEDAMGLVWAATENGTVIKVPVHFMRDKRVVTDLTTATAPADNPNVRPDRSE